MQIRTKLTLQFLGIVFTILLASLLTIYFLSADFREDVFYGRLRNKCLTTSTRILDEGTFDRRILKIIDRTNKDILFREHISVFNSLGQEIYAKNDSSFFQNAKAWVTEVREKGEKKFKQDEFEVIGIRTEDKFGDAYIIMAGAIDSQGLGELNNLRNVLILVFFIVSILVAIAGWIFAGRAMRPIAGIISQVDSISATKLSQRLDEGNKTDEIARLAATFNNMLQRIETAFKVQKTFVSNASHELKNMLTVITSQLEVLLLKDRSVEEYKTVLGSALEDIKNLNKVSKGLLELAQISVDEIHISQSAVRMDELLWQTRDELLKRNEKYRAQIIITDLPEEEEYLELQGNEALLRTAFINLMENACKFSPDNEVKIGLAASKEKIEISVSDKGIGIPAADLPNIFEPFYRAHNTALTKGHGIGLSLVQRIVQLHKGKIAVTSQVNKGTRFVVTFLH